MYLDTGFLQYTDFDSDCEFVGALDLAHYTVPESSAFEGDAVGHIVDKECLNVNDYNLMPVDQEFG